ncbi:MAG: ATP-binding protein, partial [Spirochaetaceae bacterium]|nr:ATP-binding protein [Spirochaetaceae bacterium]
NIMVIFEDLTDIAETRRELEDQRQKRESELEQIATVLKAGPQVFEGFINEASAAFDKLRKNIPHLSDPQVVGQSFRDIHSVKGTARYMDFPKVEHLTHQLEGLLADKRDGRHTDDTALEESVADLLAQLDAELDEVRSLIERFRRFAIGGENHPQSPFSVFTDRLTDMVDKIAEELGKDVRFQVESEEDEVPGLSALQPSIFHLIRNALDHGIEDSYERLAAGKDSAAELTMRISKENGWLRTEIEDDGRGLDLKALEKKGIESGLLKPGIHLPSQIINMLFLPGFSDRDEATSISGRGVGLDAVKEDMRTLKGRVNVRTMKGKGTTFILSIPVNEEGEPTYGD